MIASVLPPIPLNIATRGHLAGQYAIATRGYLALPDVVPRFPAFGYVSDAGVDLVGVLGEDEDEFVGELLLSDLIGVLSDDEDELVGELEESLANCWIGTIICKPGEGRC